MQDLLFGALLGAILAVLAAEWAAGCGESYVDAHGVRHINKCIWSK